MPSTGLVVHDVGSVQQLSLQSSEHLVPTALEGVVVAGRRDHGVDVLPMVRQRWARTAWLDDVAGWLARHPHPQHAIVS